MSERRFGFRQLPDSRDHRYSMEPVLAASPEDRRVIVDWEIGKILNQLSEGSCVGHACRSLLDASPFRQQDGPTAREIYLQARIIDEFDDNEVEEGTSVRAGLNVLKSHGLIQSYVWASTLEDVYQYIAKKGPVVVGINWYSYSTLLDWQIPMSGRPVGGHCILIFGFNRDKGQFAVQNSWGTSYGMGGIGWLAAADLEREMHRGAQVAGVVERTAA